jgi:hypothetical protein
MGDYENNGFSGTNFAREESCLVPYALSLMTMIFGGCGKQALPFEQTLKP